MTLSRPLGHNKNCMTYTVIFDCSDGSDSDGTEPDGDSDGEEDCVAENVELDKPEGTRIIDVEILCDNIVSNLVCRHCHHSVQLVEGV